MLLARFFSFMDPQKTINIEQYFLILLILRMWKEFFLKLFWYKIIYHVLGHELDITFCEYMYMLCNNLWNFSCCHILSFLLPWGACFYNIVLCFLRNIITKYLHSMLIHASVLEYKCLEQFWNFLNIFFMNSWVLNIKPGVILLKE